MTIQQQQYYYMQRQRQNTLNAYYARQMMTAQGAGGAAEKIVYPNDKLSIVVQTTGDSQVMSNGLFAAGEEPGYTKTGIYSAERDDAEKPVVIDWGDGTVEEVDGDVSQKVHEYAKAGQYMVVVENIKSYAASANKSTWYNTTSQNAYTLKEVVEIPDSVTSIGNYAFNGCTHLSSIQIPDSVTSIGVYAFRYCSSLSSIQIPDSVTSIGGNAFSGCSNITAFTVDENNQNYKSDNNLLLTKDGKTLVAGVNGNVIVPDSVTRIIDNAFQGCSSLSSIHIPDSVTSIGYSAFNSCSSLSSITINSKIAPIVESDTFGIGNNNTYTGRNTYNQGINKLYIQTGATGYDKSYWASTLQNPDKCGFTIEYI